MTSQKSSLFIVICGLCINIFIVGCSSTAEQTNKGVKQKPSNSKALSSSPKPKAIALKHKHVANICYEELTHSHVNNAKGHQHSHDCLGIDKDEKVISNAHVHPATEKSHRTRHVHPNGANKHSHH